jgi:hypothetical protein
MSCDLYRSEMYAWRPGSDWTGFHLLFEHLSGCPECARRFAQLTANDQNIQRTFQKLPDDHALENRILAGLAHQRAAVKSRPTTWKRWLLAPVAACLVLLAMLGIHSQLGQARLDREMTALLSRPPELQISSNDRQQLLAWSANILTGFASLPPELKKVEFRGAASLRVANHKAVLLKMKNERRASLLIVDGRLTRKGVGFQALHLDSGSASLWSDGQRTYVLLYEGTVKEMHTYMTEMGIGA